MSIITSSGEQTISELTNEELSELNYEVAQEMEARLKYGGTPRWVYEEDERVNLTPEEMVKLPF